jgi:hypothetical protein
MCSFQIQPCLGLYCHTSLRMNCNARRSVWQAARPVGGRPSVARAPASDADSTVTVPCQPLPEVHLRPAAGPHRPTAGHIDVPRVEYDRLSDDRLGEPSILFQSFRNRRDSGPGPSRTAETAPSLRGLGLPGQRRHTCTCTCGESVGPAEVRIHCPVDDAGASLLHAATPALRAGTSGQQLHMSARAYNELLEFAASSNWRGPSPTWPAANPSRRPTWPRQFNIGRGDRPDTQDLSTHRLWIPHRVLGHRFFDLGLRACDGPSA